MRLTCLLLLALCRSSRAFSPPRSAQLNPRTRTSLSMQRPLADRFATFRNGSLLLLASAEKGRAAVGRRARPTFEAARETAREVGGFVRRSASRDAASGLAWAQAAGALALAFALGRAASAASAAAQPGLVGSHHAVRALFVRALGAVLLVAFGVAWE